MESKELIDAKALLVLVGQCVGVAIGSATRKGEHNTYATISADAAKGALVCATALDNTLRHVMTAVTESGLSQSAISSFASGVIAGIDVTQKVEKVVPKNAETRIDISDILAKIMRKE